METDRCVKMYLCKITDVFEDDMLNGEDLFAALKLIKPCGDVYTDRGSRVTSSTTDIDQLLVPQWTLL
jgi:hypothetical protein